MRKALTLLIACLLLACLFACNKAQPAAATAAESTTIETTSETTTEATTESTTQTTTTTITSTTTTKPTTTTTTTKAPLTTLPSPQNVIPSKYVGSAKSGPLTWEEYLEACGAAQDLVGRYAGQSLEARLEGVYAQLRAPVDQGRIEYSMDKPHYADPYGYLILRVASCAGSARTAGLCLDVLGIPWEHVNPGAFTHQWARVNVNGTYWICDPYGMYVGPEPAPYKHPHFET